MSLLLLFQSGGEAAPVVDNTGGWLSEEQVRRLRKREREIEREEAAYKAKVEAKKRRLEEMVREAYDRAAGRPILKEALGERVSDLSGSPRQDVEVAADVAARLARAVEGRGRRFGAEKRLAVQIQQEIAELERLIAETEAIRAEDDETAAMLLLAAV